MEQAREIDVFVAGAGLSGAVFIANLLRAKRPVSIVVAERSGRFFRGVAYDTPSAAHLLNVPVGRMSAFASEPDHFFDWMKARRPETGRGDFVERRAYGDYLASVVDDALSGAAPGSSLQRVVGAVTEAKRRRGGFLVRAGGQTFRSRTLVLATGNGAPALPARVLGDAGTAYTADPWAIDALSGIAFDAPVLLFGTGLTAVDVLVRLRELGHRGTVHAISRRGLLPRAHATFPSPATPPPSTLPRSLRELTRLLRRHAAVHGWRATVDGFRAHTRTAWRGLDRVERERFLRHLRPFWDAHRHRMAPAVAQVVDAECSAGTLTVTAGRLLSATTFPGGALVRFRERNTGVMRSFPVARIVNATGPTNDLRDECDPFLAGLREDGWISSDPLGLGLSCDPKGRVCDADGSAQADLFALGPLRRGDNWESTAAPEIREQARIAAECVLEELADRPVPVQVPLQVASAAI